MAFGVCIVFENVGEAQYWAVNSRLGVNKDGSGDWPAGMLRHTCGITPNGLIVTEEWETKAAAEAFAQGRLAEAMQAEAIPAPTYMFPSDIINTFTSPT